MKLIDLSHTITDKTMPFPGDPYPSFHKFLSVEKDFCNCYEYHTTLHNIVCEGGTPFGEDENEEGIVSLLPVNTEEELDMLLAHVLGDDGGGADD